MRESIERIWPFLTFFSPPGMSFSYDLYGDIKITESQILSSAHHCQYVSDVDPAVMMSV